VGVTKEGFMEKLSVEHGMENKEVTMEAKVVIKEMMMSFMCCV